MEFSCVFFFVLLLDRIASTGLFVVVLSQYLALIHRTFFHQIKYFKKQHYRLIVACWLFFLLVDQTTQSLSSSRSILSSDSSHP